MKVNHDLRRIMQYSQRGHNIGEENEAGVILAAGILLCALILMLAVLVSLFR